MTARILTVATVCAALAVSSGLGWDAALWDPRLQLTLHLLAALAILGLALVAWRGGLLPRTPLDLPIAALLVAFGLATVSAWNIGLSAPALAGIAATAAILLVALLALHHRRDLTVLVAVVPQLGLAAVALVVMVWRRVEWLMVGAGGWPPIRLANEGTPFGSVAVAPFVILASIPLVLLLAQPRLRRGILVALLAVGLPLVVLSGSRSAWIATAVTIVVLGVPLARTLRRRQPPALTQLAVAIAGVGAAAATVGFVGSRLTDSSSLAYRERLWDATLSVWRGDPWLGIGPGAMPYARQAVAPLLQLHSHDVPLGILGDAGIAGLGAALLVFAAFLWVARPKPGSSLAGRAAYAATIGIAVGFLSEDLTFLPNFNLLILLLAATALLEAGAVSWRPVQFRRSLIAPAVVAAAGLLTCAVLADAAAVMFQGGTGSAAAGNWAAARAQLAAAVALDPLHPAGPKALAVAADWSGDAALARRMALAAAQLNPGDWASHMNLSLLCRAADDRACAVQAADEALRTSGRSGISLVDAAQVYAWAGETAKADAAYQASLADNLTTSLVLPWPRPVEIGDEAALERGSTRGQLTLLVARRVRGEPLRPSAYASASIRALAQAMAGDVLAARDALAAAMRNEGADPLTWDVIALLRRHWGEDDSAALRIGAVTRGAPLPVGIPAIPPSTYDFASLRAYPADGLVRGAQRLLTDQPWPWFLDRLLAP